MDRPVDRYGDTLARWTTEELENLVERGLTLINAASIADELEWRKVQD